MNFLLPEHADRLHKLLRAADKACKAGGGKRVEYDAGLDCDAWKLIGPPHMRRFLQLADVPSADDAARNAAAAAARALDELRQVMLSPAMARLLFALCGAPLSEARAQVRRFRPSLDYTVAHYGDVNHDERLLATLCFCDESLENPSASAQPSNSNAASSRASTSSKIAAASTPPDDGPPPQSIWRGGDVGGFEWFVVSFDGFCKASEIAAHAFL